MKVKDVGKNVLEDRTANDKGNADASLLLEQLQGVLQENSSSEHRLSRI
jgi:hypothetical protein